VPGIISRRRLVGGGLAAALLAACGGAATPTPRLEPTPRATIPPALATAAVEPGRPLPTGTVAPAGTPAVGQGSRPPARNGTPAAVTPAPGGRPSVFTWALEQDPGSFDNQREVAQSAVDAQEHVYESLTQLDERLEPVPALARAVERAPDGMSYRFQLDGAARFHDGAEVTAEDVKWSFDRLLSPELRSPWAESWLEPLLGATVVDRMTVRLDLKRPFPHLPSVLAALRGSAIMPREADRRIDLRTQARGTGPFRLKEYRPGDQVLYERNREYRQRDQPKIDGMLARVVPDEAARASALLSGQIDYATFSPETMSRLQGQPDLRLLGTPLAWIGTVAFPFQQFPQFKDWRVRRAFSLVVDREEVIRKSLLTAGTLSGNVPAGYGDWALPEGELKERLKRDVGAAQQLMAEAGFMNGKNFPKVRLIASPQYPELVTNAQVLQANLRDIGVEAEVAVMEWGTYVALTSKGDHELGMQIASFYPDPDLYLWPLAHSRSLVGQRGYRHRQQEELDRLLDQVRSGNGTREERRGMVQQIDRLLLDDPPQLVLYGRLNLEAIGSRVKGYTPSYTGRRPGFRSITLG
jgi:peptide/nickel transport system substrate-binding protein